MCGKTPVVAEGQQGDHVAEPGGRQGFSQVMDPGREKNTGPGVGGGMIQTMVPWWWRTCGVRCAIIWRAGQGGGRRQGKQRSTKRATSP